MCCLVEAAAYVTDIIMLLKHFYKIDFEWRFQVTSILASGAIGYSIAGLGRSVVQIRNRNSCYLRLMHGSAASDKLEFSTER